MFGGFDEEDQRWFADGMLANAIAGAEHLRREVDFSAFRRLLDVGGNSGGYTLSLLEAHPSLEATIFDLPAVRPLAEERIGERGLGERCQFVEGSFFEDPLPKGHDVLLLANILHDWETPECRRILAACREATEAGRYDRGRGADAGGGPDRAGPRLRQRPDDGAPRRREPHAACGSRSSCRRRGSSSRGGQSSAHRTAW